MAMIMAMNILSDEKIGQIIANPELLWKTLAPEGPEVADNAFDSINNDRSIDFIMDQDEYECTDLDKSWHAIHFMLTGSAWEGESPLNFIVCGGQEIDKSDIGYGPSRALSSDEIVEIKKALDQIGIDEFRSRYDPDAMMKNQIYPDIWDRYDEAEKNLEYLVEKFEIMKEFIESAFLKSQGLIITIC